MSTAVDYNPVLETERLVLRRLERNDAEDIYAYARDPEVARYTAFTAHTSVADAHVFLDRVLARYDACEPSEWGIVERASGRLIGACGFPYHALAHRRVEIGYAIARSHWGRGLVTEAARAMVAHAVGTLGFYRVEAICDPRNVGSARVMEKIGMRFEGLLRAYLWKEGGPRDVKLYAILADEVRA